MNQWIKYLPTAVAVLLIASYRLLPHPWNFAPVCAMAIFGGIYLNRALAFALPIASMMVADMFLGMDWRVTPVIYGSIAISTMIGFWIRSDNERKPKFLLKVFGGTLASAVQFFILTNFITWVTLDMYTKDWNGLVQCYVLAIPFFQNAIAGDLFFIAVFVGIYELVQWGVSHKIGVEKSVA